MRRERRLTRDVMAVRSMTYKKFERIRLNHEKKVK